MPPSKIASLTPASPSGLILVGGGRNAHNLICIFEEVGVAVRGIVDDHLTGKVLGHEVESIKSLNGAKVDTFLTIANPDHASKIRERSDLSYCRWPYFIHPSSIASSHSKIGEGSYVGPFNVLTDITLGRHVHLFAHNVLGARVSVGDFTTILPHATVASDVRIGKRCLIGMGARIHAGVTIGDDCRIGVNTVVRRDMPNNSLALSRDATLMRTRIAFNQG